MDDGERQRLRAIGRHLEVFERPGFSFGDWTRPSTDADGVITLGWYEFSAEAEAFLKDVRAWIEPLDWPAWAQSAKGQALLGHPEAVASASADDLRKLLTVNVRSERFGDGTLENVFNSGMLTAIVRRAAALGDGGQP